MPELPTPAPLPKPPGFRLKPPPDFPEEDAIPAPPDPEDFIPQIELEEPEDAGDSDSPVEDVVPSEPPVPPADDDDSAPPPAKHHAGVVVPSGPKHEYPSLYDSHFGSVAAIFAGVAILVGMIFSVERIFQRKQPEHKALTHFVMMLVSVLVAVFLVDMLVAGPSAELLSEEDRHGIVEFIKDICLVVLAYYFGTKAPPPAPDEPSE